MWGKIQAWIGIASLLFIGWVIFIDEPKNKGLPPSAKTNDTQPVTTFSQPAQPLPQTGYNTATFGNGVAPLNGLGFGVSSIDLVDLLLG